MDFGGLRIAFDDRVLRPRPWTAAQSAWAAEILATGARRARCSSCAPAPGQIGLLAVAVTDRRLVCVDLDPVACDFARRNAAAAGLADRVEVREGPIDETVRDDERFAVVVADPPWVPRAETGRYPEDPLLAIDGGDDGMDVAWTCVGSPPATCCPAASRCSSSAPSTQVAPDQRLRCTSSASSAGRCAPAERGVLLRVDRP